ncbi:MULTISPECIES: SpoIIIAH-like family protein [unclassified Cytobacillus]|uniref:SpoIIIAH-like family protein n=1 Tax=unclassified Cytobacillus TaxID=2675268 RepID=UPI00135AD3E7|nr:SpoIIIAH-like family protein [Cytobacillus sp. AMY 15.2]KAF0818442.1 Stage III sporulation protein AH [Bacillus sp. ZZV12-4809]MCM3091520.1 SpoIIIAH-like family protein [Cytobacillus sp. AMY 15.2]
MLLKKQTVWLLTMLSLVVVLSVYYVTSPEQKGSDLAGMEEKAAGEMEAVESEDGKAIITNTASDEMFENLRLQLDDERSRMKEGLQEVLGQTDLPAEERMKAKDQIDELNEIAQKEAMLETLIRAMDYEDVLVRADGKKVQITVKAKDHSPAAANNIIQEVRNEIGKLEAVAVEFQVEK